MKFTSIVTFALVGMVHGYTEITQWTGLDCGAYGARTSYLYIDGYNVYLNRDNQAASVYIEQYDARGPSFFYSGYGGSGFRGSEIRQGYCYRWDNIGARSIANPVYYRKQRREDEMVEGKPVSVDEHHQGLGGFLTQEFLDINLNNATSDAE